MAEPTADEDFQRELAARRKDLEREFADKARDLKSQHQRRMDALKQEQADWEQARRARTKELADREEKVRRHEENARKAEGLKAEERKELEDLRQRVKDLDQARVEAKVAAAASQAKVSKARHALRSSGRLVPWFAALSVLGGALWLATAWSAADRGSSPLAAAFLAASLLLTAVHAWSLRRTRG